MKPSLNTLYYKKISSSNNKAMIFLHGLGSSHHCWKNDYTIFAQKYSLYFVDLLGFGLSAKPDKPYTLETHIEALDQFLVTEVPEKEYFFIGHSLGAVIALSYTYMYPRKIVSSILMGLPYYHSENEAHRIIQKATKYPQWFYTDTMRAKLAYTLLCQIGKPIAQLVLPFFSPHLTTAIHDIFLHRYISMISTIKYVILEQNIPNILSRTFKNKILLLHGLYDDLAPLANIQELSQQFQVPLFTIQGNHGFPLDQTARTIEIINKYL